MAYECNLCILKKGYFFAQLPKMPTLKLSFSESLALTMAIQAAERISGIDAEIMSGVAKRLESLFPSPFDTLLQGVRKRKTGPCRISSREEMLFTINHALAARNKIKIVYEARYKGKDVKERIVVPYCLLPYVRSWHLVGWCQLRNAIRTFKIDRIKKAEILKEHYRIPEDFDVDDYLGATWGIMRMEGKEPERVVLKFDSTAGKWVVEESWHATQKSEELADGSFLFELTVVVTPEFVNWILYYGARVEVVEPHSLRQRVADAHRDAAELYSRE